MELGFARIFFHVFHHVIEGFVLAPNVNIELAIGFVHFVEVDLHQTFTILFGDGLQFGVERLELLVQSVALLLDKAFASHTYQGGDYPKDGVDGGGEGRHLFQAVQHHDCSVLNIFCISHHCEK